MSTGWQRLHAGPVVSGTFKQQHSDFIVHEQLGFAPEPVEKGQHHWLWLEKQGVNTAFIAKSLARELQIPQRDVSYSGMKDRFGITRQWFSVALPALAEPDWQGCIAGLFAAEQVRLLQHVRSHRKLRRGVHKANDFVLRLHNINDMPALQQRLALVASSGAANYYGEQRFGIQRQNLNQALAMFAGKRIKQRDLRGILLSAARSWLFNHYLQQRIARHGNALLPGDVFMLAGSHSFFVAEALDATIAARVASGDILPSGPLFGDLPLVATDAAALLEQEILAAWPEYAKGLANARLSQDRRPLWLQPEGLEWQVLGADSVELRFTLPSGCFATAILAELGDFTSLERAGFGSAHAVEDN